MVRMRTAHIFRHYLDPFPRINRTLSYNICIESAVDYNLTSSTVKSGPTTLCFGSVSSTRPPLEVGAKKAKPAGPGYCSISIDLINTLPLLATTDIVFKCCAPAFQLCSTASRVAFNSSTNAEAIVFQCPVRLNCPRFLMYFQPSIDEFEVSTFIFYKIIDNYVLFLIHIVDSDQDPADSESKINGLYSNPHLQSLPTTPTPRARVRNPDFAARADSNWSWELAAPRFAHEERGRSGMRLDANPSPTLSLTKSAVNADSARAPLSQRGLWALTERRARLWFPRPLAKRRDEMPTSRCARGARDFRCAIQHARQRSLREGRASLSRCCPSSTQRSAHPASPPRAPLARRTPRIPPDTHARTAPGPYRSRARAPASVRHGAGVDTTRIAPARKLRAAPIRFRWVAYKTRCAGARARIAAAGGGEPKKERGRGEEMCLRTWVAVAGPDDFFEHVRRAAGGMAQRAVSGVGVECDSVLPAHRKHWKGATQFGLRPWGACARAQLNTGAGWKRWDEFSVHAAHRVRAGIFNTYEVWAGAK
ncbi:hypothetical protein DFH06DRAFT_1412767 [Mycena polygramma]|nr:hypothetical protein DFH06DRAFT_1412767 [Mycena polygramma]